MTSCRSQWNEVKGGYNDVINELISVTDQKNANEEWRNENMVSIDLERVSCRFELFRVTYCDYVDYDDRQVMNVICDLTFLLNRWSSVSCFACHCKPTFLSLSFSLSLSLSLFLSLSLSLPRLFSISSVKHGEVHWRDMLIRNRLVD